MSRKDGDIRIPLNQIGAMSIRDQALIVERKPKVGEPSLELRRARTNRWWNTNFSMDFVAKIEIWVNEEGAKMDADAGGRTEIASHNASEYHADDVLVAKLRRTKGHLRDVDLIEKAERELRRIEQAKRQEPGSYARFGLKFIDLLGEARDLSESRVEKLKSDYQVSLN